MQGDGHRALSDYHTLIDSMRFGQLKSLNEIMALQQ